MLGYFYNPTISTTLVASGNAQSSITIQTAGYYLFTYNLLLSSTGSLPTEFYTSLNGTNAPTSAVGFTYVNSINRSNNSTAVINCTASTYSLMVSYTGGTGTLSINISGNPYFQAIRIG